MRNLFTRVLALLFFFAIGRGLLAQTPGFTPVDESPTGSSGALKAQVQTGGSYNAYNGNATRIVPDLQVPGALGDYGLDFTRYWNSNNNDYDDGLSDWPTDFGMSGWSHSWHWRAEYVAYTEMPVDGGELLYHTSIIITFPDGHTTKYKIVRSSHPVGLPPNVVFPDPRLGPPYTEPEINSGFPYGGMGVHDHLCKMDPNGTDFWLCRADGGSVHFTGGSGNYYATEVYDPHGLKTTLRYNVYGDLYQVEQEGGRLLNIKWGLFNPGGWRVITKVETGGTAGYQRVQYTYERLNGGYFLVLSSAVYADDPAPGEATTSRYIYGTCYGEEPEPCDTSGQVTPMLKRADDPRYEGAMTKIRYTFRGEACPPPLVRPWEHPNYVPVQPYAIATEKSDDGVLVSQFTLECRSGVREEYTGLGGRRRFYFGSAAQTGVSAPPPEGPFICRGFQLGKVTDFTTIAYIQSGTPCPPGVDCDRQNYSFGNPRQIWDGLNIMTEEIAVPGDDSGEPGRINYLDGSYSTYDRIGDPSDLDTNRMKNSYNHWLFKKTDELGHITRYTRDARRRVVRIDYHDNSVETFEYDNNDPNGLGQVTRHTLPSEAVEIYEYDPHTHLLVREYNSVDGWEARKEYEYDSLGRVAKMTDGRARNSTPPAPFTVKMTYNGRHKVTSVEYPPTGGGSNPTVRYDYDKYGNCTVMTDELGHRKEFTYDSYRRCTSYIEWVFGPGPDCNNIYSRQWNWVYDRVAPNGVDTFPSAAHTSSKWRLQIEPPFNSTGHRRATARNYDFNDRMNFEFVGIIVPSQGPWIYDEGSMHRYAYDGNGQKRSYIDPQNRETTYVYDIRNRPWKTNEYPYPNTGVARTTETLYDPTGNKLSVKFPDQQMQHWEDYDAFGQPRRFIDERSNPTDLIYCWGPMKKLYKVITHRASGTEDQLTEFGYDLMGRPTQTVFPDTTREKSTYEFGQVKDWTTRRGQVKRLQYDARGREVSHTWDYTAAPGINRVWDDANRLTRISNSFAIIDYSYDYAGQVVTEGTTVAGSGGQTPAGSGVLRQLSYCRYPSGEVARVTYPNGFVLQRAYTARGQLETVRDGSQIELVKYTYLKDGKVDFQDYGNGVRSDFGYDGRGMISSVHHKRNASGANLSYRDYWRDDRDRITAWKRSIDSGLNGMEDGSGDRYHYDLEGQLDGASYRVPNPEPGGTPGPSLRTDIFHYDALGNREGSNYVASLGTLNFNQRSNGLNQYAAWMPYSPIFYDDHYYASGSGPANGVLTENGWTTASYNALNQPVGMWSPAYPGGASPQIVWFGHDPLGRCVKRWVGPNNRPPANVNPATYYYYDGWNLVQEGSSATNAERVYVHGGRVDEIVASQAGGVWNYHQYDARGHCTLLTNTSGEIREQYDYDAFGYPYTYNRFGASVVASAQWGNRFLFTGREWLRDLRVYDYRNRMYYPELGRFLQPDPKHFQAGDYNLYRYCHNDPVNKSDPSGLMPDGWEGQEYQGDVMKGMLAGAAVGIAILAAPVVAEAGLGALALRGAFLIRAAVTTGSAYKIAQAGGRHAGFLQNNLNKNAAQLQSGIRSITKLIAEHQAKIANPQKFITNFNQLDPRRQQALVQKIWPADIKRQQEQLEILKKLHEKTK